MILQILFLAVLTNDALGNVNILTLEGLQKELLALKESYRFESTTQMKRISQLEEKLAKKEDVILALEDSVRRLEETLKTLVPRTDHVGSRVHSVKKRQSGVMPAFSVYLSHNSNLGAGQTIVFDQAIINEGNGYNVYTGMFTCPMAGLYLFSFEVMVMGVSDNTVTGAWVDLVVNARNTEDGAVDAHHQVQELQGGNTVVLRLNVGDAVWLANRGANDHVDGSTGLHATSFTGVFLHA
ncbi:complement C1q-like protein 4 [Dreissena polymorpha]|uniref:C1q domain-containing protein n=1 Tax=Dreissena polymorpha TaxID=45954 RepID=A0A9D4JGK7_DREPO|nr:complement C1q-like protein 4 [Dreissena polymorpha]XP_052218960.1 complement C1q-like protein 4 [Dreissena polymorpha]KAH3811911.1 hypothetical protein DPMN_140328 [Dreissena polymorpha]